jgi:hypothetical protein
MLFDIEESKMIVTLNQTEQELAQVIAQRRYEAARGQGLTDLKVGEQSNWETDLEGAAAEIAFCKLANVYPDMETGRSNIEDCYLKNGYAVDVKTTRYEGGRLLAVRWKRENSVDLYALMVGTFPKYRLAGFMRAEDLIQEARLKDLGRGPSFAADQSELMKPDDVIF